MHLFIGLLPIFLFMAIVLMTIRR